MAREATVFCATQSRQVDDPLPGTGAHATCNLLISWPSGKWLRSLRKARDMSDAVLDRIEAVFAGGRRVNLIHRQQQASDRHRIYLMPENLTLEVPRKQLPDFLEALLNGDDLEAWGATRADKPLILCCTHGKKDKCCAKFGNATFQALERAVAQGGGRFEVWQSSHLGGCRLAASTMVFPATRKYGRLDAGHIEPLLAAELADRPYWPCYRGNSTLNPLQQCAEVAALQWLESNGVVARVEPESGGEVAEGRATVVCAWRSDDAQGRLVVHCAQSRVLRYDTCADIGPDGPSTATVWRASDVQALESSRSTNVTAGG
ncbi:sucrase ferredoxin [Marinobacter sp. JSM 1782161]|uniref:sucrase ferredoxin n=1 Tax=Marinobacter sp. JSM 1782161 TaxID=2685906 RepID=UPI001402E0E6|nr:sucrase ferredoxin [Marinobacter sp. JSM 1782161]